MNRTELEELIRNGENSGVEFKRDDVVPERLAKELAALLNLEGGHLLLGVEDDGTVTGLTRAPKQVEEWIMEVARVHLRPAAIPFWETLKLDDGNVVGVISLPADAPDKPYKAKRGSAWVTQVGWARPPAMRRTQRKRVSTCSPGTYSTTASQFPARRSTTSTCDAW